MSARINDGLTTTTRFMRRQVEKGLCEVCQQVRVFARHCQKHRQLATARQRRYRERGKALARVLRGDA